MSEQRWFRNAHRKQGSQTTRGDLGSQDQEAQINAWYAAIMGVHAVEVLDLVIGSEELSHAVRIKAAQRALDELRATARDRNDPVEQMLLEQIVLLHHRLLTLQGSAGQLDRTDTQKERFDAISALSREYRQLVKTLDEHRSRHAKLQSQATQTSKPPQVNLRLKRNETDEGAGKEVA